MSELLFKEESFRIIGVCMEIHKALGMGLKEMDFAEQDINYIREKKFSIKYKDKILRHPYVADFVVYDSIIIEVKSVAAIIDTHLAQGLSYLAVSGMKLVLVINFGERSLTWKRIVL